MLPLGKKEILCGTMSEQLHKLFVLVYKQIKSLCLSCANQVELPEVVLGEVIADNQNIL